MPTIWEGERRHKKCRCAFWERRILLSKISNYFMTTRPYWTKVNDNSIIALSIFLLALIQRGRDHAILEGSNKRSPFVVCGLFGWVEGGKYQPTIICNWSPLCLGSKVYNDEVVWRLVQHNFFDEHTPADVKSITLATMQWQVSTIFRLVGVQWKRQSTLSVNKRRGNIQTRKESMKTIMCVTTCFVREEAPKGEGTPKL